MVSRYLITYTLGKAWRSFVVDEVSADFAIARFYKRPISRHPAVVFREIFICRDSFECGEAAKPLGFITPSQSLTELPNGTEGL